VTGLWRYLAGLGIAVVALRFPRVIDALVHGDLPAKTAAVSALLLAPMALSLWFRARAVRRARGEARDGIDGWTTVACAAIATVGLAALLAPVLTPYDPEAISPLLGAQPSWTHPFGTDPVGRDLLSRFIFGARVSLSIALISILIAVVIGIAVGTVAGLAGNVTDAVLMRGVDAGLAFPRIFLILVMFAFSQRVGPTAVVLILGFTSWFGLSRIVRAEVLSIRERDYMVATRALGIGGIQTLVRHVFPNVVGPVAVTATLGVGYIILLESSLAYLGVGVPEPTPSWGRILNDVYPYLASSRASIAIIPGALIGFTVIAFGLLGDGLRNAFTPQTR